MKIVTLKHNIETNVIPQCSAVSKLPNDGIILNVTVNSEKDIVFSVTNIRESGSEYFSSPEAKREILDLYRTRYNLYRFMKSGSGAKNIVFDNFENGKRVYS